MKLLLLKFSVWIINWFCFSLPCFSFPQELPTQNTTESQCDREQISSNGTNVCLVRTWPPECLGYISLAGVVGFAAFFLSLPCLLAAVGFDFIGIVAGSLAALFQVSVLMLIPSRQVGGGRCGQCTPLNSLSHTGLSAVRIFCTLYPCTLLHSHWWWRKTSFVLKKKYWKSRWKFYGLL